MHSRYTASPLLLRATRCLFLLSLFCFATGQVFGGDLSHGFPTFSAELGGFSPDVNRPDSLHTQTDGADTDYSSILPSYHENIILILVAGVSAFLLIVVLLVFALLRQRRSKELLAILEEQAEDLANSNRSLRREIAERKAVEETLQGTRDQLRAVLDTIPGCVSWIGADLRYRGINEYLSQILGMSPSEVEGQPVGFKGSDPEFMGFVKEFFEDSAQKANRMTKAMIGGKEHHFLIVAQKYNEGKEAVFVGLDITERQRTEEEKAMLEEQLRNTVQDGIVTVDRNGVVSGLNEAATSIFNTSRENAVGTPLHELCGPDREAVAEVIQQSLTRGELVRGVQVSCERAGRALSYILSVTPITGDTEEGALVVIRDVSRLRDLELEVSQRFSFENIIGKSPAMEKVFEMVRNVADTDLTVLIQGASGTGKELIAEALHHHGSVRDGPLVKVNCAALPETLLESELFGHTRGAFTGATRDKRGRFEEANGGTIFLDEVGDMSPGLQQRLLRVLQEREFERVGSTQTIKVDVRIVAATNRDLSQLVAAGTFREDLFYRLNVVTIHLPPLVERKEDITLLVQHFLRRSQARLGRVVKGIAPEAMEVLLSCGWPGNVRQLENAIEHAVVLSSDGFIRAESLPPEVFRKREDTPRPREKEGTSRADSQSGGSQAPSVDKDTLEDTLESVGWNRARAARKLGISRTTLWKRIKEFDLSPPEE